MTVNTEIKEVQIYRSGCTAIRSGQAALEAGVNHVLISGLTSSAYTDTMRLRFGENVKASAIHVINETEEEEKESDRLAEKIRQIQAKTEALNQQAEMWKNNAGFANLQNATITEVENYIIAYPQRIEAIKKEISDLAKEKKALEKELNQVCEQENRPLAAAELTVEKSGVYPFEMSYQESAASWNSMYEIHTDAENPLQIQVKAQIRQNTGEDWKRVKATLRTGSPSFSSGVPKLSPAYLDFRKQRVYASSAPMMMKATSSSINSMALEEMSEGAMADEDTAALVPLRMDEAEINTADTMTEYILSGEYDISNASDGLSVDLQSFEIKAEYAVVAVPKADIRTYLTAKIRTEDLPMIISGNAAVYLKDMYTGTALISPDRTEETFSIVIGNEERISVFREGKRKKGTEALIRNSRSEEYETVIRAVNSKTEPVHVIVKDQVPVSREQSVTVEVKQTDQAVQNPETGELTWEIDLQPDEIRILHVKYKVSWPKDKTIQVF